MHLDLHPQPYKVELTQQLPADHSQRRRYLATATYCALRGDFGLYNHPTMQAIGKIERPVHHHFADSAKYIAIVSESGAEDPNVSIPRCSQVLGYFIMLHFAFRSTPTSIKNVAQATTEDS